MAELNVSTGFFVKFNNTIMDVINKVGDTYQAQYASGIMGLMVGSITLYILWFGYSTLAGKNKTPVDDLVWNLARFAMITAFISNAGGYLTSLSEALQGLKDGFSGGTSVWATLDTLWINTQHLATGVYQQDISWVPVEGGLAMLAIWAGSIALMFTSAVVFLTADLTMKFMLITAPIFLFCLMFGFLRPMFNNWLQLIFSSILTVLFASIVINLAVDFQTEMASQVKAVQEGNLMTLGVMGGVAGLLSSVLVTIAASFATKLAGAGAEGAIQGMAMAGIMNGAQPAAKATGRGAGKVTGAAAGAAGSLAEKTGDAAYSAMNSPAKVRAKAAVEAMKAYTASQQKPHL